MFLLSTLLIFLLLYYYFSILYHIPISYIYISDYPPFPIRYKYPPSNVYISAYLRSLFLPFMNTNILMYIVLPISLVFLFPFINTPFIAVTRFPLSRLTAMIPPYPSKDRPPTVSQAPLLEYVCSSSISKSIHLFL